MGEVYRAKDLDLGRTVAVKLLREDLASDPERLKRFEQEARSASALNHPNIVTIHAIGDSGTSRYIAMEYVDGRTLRSMDDVRVELEDIKEEPESGSYVSAKHVRSDPRKATRHLRWLAATSGRPIHRRHLHARFL